MKPTLAFVSLSDAANPNAESGYAFSMRQQLQKRFEVIDLFPFPLGQERRWLPLRLAYKVAGLAYHPSREPAALKSLAFRIEQDLRRVKPDVVFAPSSLPMTFVDAPCPTAFSTDQLFCDFAEGYVHRPSKRFVRLGNAQEAMALKRATWVTYPSDWAANSARQHCPSNPGKVAMIPWGANLPFDVSESDVQAAIAGKSFDSCHLVFMGRDWQRKRGDTFVGIVNQMNKLGLKTRATIIGANPRGLSPEVFTIHTHLDKQKPAHMKRLASILLDAHFLILPSRAEAFGHALSEAMAFGVPVIASTVGGMTTVVREGETGFLRPPEAPAEELAHLIRDTLARPSEYLRMAREAREDFRHRLNWDVFGKQFNESIAALV